jgi:phage shock protein A
MSFDQKIQYIKFLDTLTDAMGDNEEQNNDEIREELREEGFDIEAIEADLMKFQQKVAMAAKRQALDEAEIKRKKSQPAVHRISEIIKDFSNIQVLERIKELMGFYPDMAVSHRELEVKKEEDLRTLLEDLERARLMSESDDENGQK